MGAYITIDDNSDISAGQKIGKIPRNVSKVSDITGGLPRVTELFEARNPSNPAVVSEIDGIVFMVKSKEVIAKSLWKMSVRLNAENI